MTAETSPLATPEEFGAALSELLERAEASGVDVEGGWTCPDGDELPDWDVIVTAVRADGDGT